MLTSHAKFYKLGLLLTFDTTHLIQYRCLKMPEIFIIKSIYAFALFKIYVVIGFISAPMIDFSAIKNTDLQHRVSPDTR